VREKCVQYIVAALIKGFSRTIQDTACKQCQLAEVTTGPSTHVRA